MQALSRYLAMAVVAVAGASAFGGEQSTTPVAADIGSLKQVTIDDGNEATAPLQIRGADARQQLIVTGSYTSGAQRDLTRQVHYDVSPAGVISVDDKGLITPLGDGSATLSAKTKDGPAAELSVNVKQFGEQIPVNFPNQIVPIFTKLGCNSGGCHGKSGGQNGFRLSLLGFEPTEDYEHLVKESRGRRIFPADPERSLLLLKATGTLPHGGGKRIEIGSDEYRLLVRWISQGMPYGKADDPVIKSIEVFPQQRIMARGGDQQLLVTARYSDGSTEDVTRQALFEANEKEMAGVDSSGFVNVNQQPGDVAVMVRYQARVGVFRSMIPLGAKVDNLPVAKNFIDDLVFKKLKAIGMPPSAICSDETFLRRASIDIAGRFPTEEELQAFMADRDPSKRDRCVDRLVDSTGYADYFADKWSALLRNRRAQASYAKGTFEFHDWIRDSLLTNKPYDQFVREILTASGDIDDNPPVAWYRQVKDPNAQLEDVGQLFLGMRMHCAQCHHHPFEKWSQHDYYSFAAFFSNTAIKAGNNQSGEEIVYHRRGNASAVNPKTRQSVKPATPGGEALNLSPDDDPRVALVDWMTRRDNPYFARSLANRYWKHFFGRGIVEPEDDIRDTNPPTNPELLDALASHFAASGYDLKDLVRTICKSQTYQLDSIPNAVNEIDKQNFSRYYPKRLEAEVLLDSVNDLTGAKSRFAGLPTGTEAIQLPDNSFNSSNYFLTVFGRPDSSSSCECERSGEASLAQSLHLLNAREIQDMLTAGDGRAAKMAADKTHSDEEKIAELYCIAFARQPEPSEMAAAKGYIEQLQAKAGKKEDKASVQRRAYEDLIWALINTKEFSFNH
ncbi:MAG TPA: DUF1549 and DUF1553 domain-containing protein [Tepidisphaeraceae bacterium]|jgi:hypothetical protein|nr:DUF1549 and DUF1553 domain-containing protein [Tepidisphaeraceae bacterium]